MTNLDISYLVVFTLQIVCDAILVWGALKKIPNHLVPWLWANAVIIAVFLVSILFAKNLIESDARKNRHFFTASDFNQVLEMMIFKNGSERDSNHVESLLRISEVKFENCPFFPCCDFPHF